MTLQELVRNFAGGLVETRRGEMQEDGSVVTILTREMPDAEGITAEAFDRDIFDVETSWEDGLAKVRELVGDPAPGGKA